MKENCVHTLCQRSLQVIAKLVVWNSVLRLKHYSDQGQHFLQCFVAEVEQIHRATTTTPPPPPPKKKSMTCQHTSPFTELKPRQCLVQGRSWQLYLVTQSVLSVDFRDPRDEMLSFVVAHL
jgi:hypothetical protein